MKNLPQISEAEFEVMKIVWKYAPINTNEITEKLLQTTSWSPKTIQTLIKRLVTKGVLTYEKQSRVFVYTPLVKECEYISQESNSFLNRSHWFHNLSSYFWSQCPKVKKDSYKISPITALPLLIFIIPFQPPLKICPFVFYIISLRSHFWTS